MTSHARRHSATSEALTNEELLRLRQMLEEDPAKSARRRDALLDVARALNPKRSRIQVRARERCLDVWRELLRGTW